METVAAFLNIGFNTAGIFIALKIMFDIWAICGKLDEILQLLAEIRDDRDGKLK